MIVAVADTHAVIWYLSKDQRLSLNALNIIDEAILTRDKIAVSAITLVEMVYLVEKGKIPPQGFTQLIDELQNHSSVFEEIPVNFEIARALTHINAAQIPDMPDRVVAATAFFFDVPIISRDGKIRLSSLRTIW